ncbi:SH3 domain-containing protein [Marinospirillum alkaliphilum]|nr:SH3 domain-containing protein [Marinospirillum alkaliphilum]
MKGTSNNTLRLKTRLELSSWSNLLSVLVLVLVIGFCSVSVQASETETWRVSVPVGNVRAAPQGDAALVIQLPAGTQVVELERSGVWLRVRLPDGQEAWMHQVTLTQAVELFGQPLLSTDRASLRAAIQAANVAVVREVDGYPYDLYDPSGWMAGATEMAVGYTPGQQQFAVAEITFRSFNDTEQVRRIADQVSRELGPWQRVLGRRAEGPVEFEWRRGELRILVHRGWPDTTTYLTYEVPTRLQALNAQLDNQ